MEKIIQEFLFIGQGIVLSLELMAGGLISGLVLGTVFAILRYEKIAVFPINQFISIMRGTPLILQLSFVYFALPALINVKASILQAGILTFGLNSSAYVAEIIRSGIESVPKGQFEAARALHIPNFYLWKDIILPQVLNNIFPALVNEMITLLKDTALISTIGGVDIMRRAQSIAAEQFTYFLPLCIAGVYYYALVLLIAYISKKIEAWRNHHVAH